MRPQQSCGLCSQPRLPTQAEFCVPPSQAFPTVFPARVRGQDGMGSSEPLLLTLASKNRPFFLCPGLCHGPCRKMYIPKADGASGSSSWPHARGSGHSQVSQDPGVTPGPPSSWLPSPSLGERCTFFNPGSGQNLGVLGPAGGHSRDSSPCHDPGEPSKLSLPTILETCGHPAPQQSPGRCPGKAVPTARAVRLPRHESQPALSSALRIQKLEPFPADKC